MSLESILATGLTLLFLGLIVTYTVLGTRRPWRNLRPIPAFTRFGSAIGRAVEAGSRLHLSLGRGAITNPSSATGLIGLSVLRRITTVASASDYPPIASSGDGALAILSQDTLKSTYKEIGAAKDYEPTAGRVSGLTPFSYAAGTLPITRDEKVAVNVLAGSFGTEITLMLDASERSEVFTLAGTENLPAQSILYATAQEPLIGEEVFAAPAYINAGPVYTASLRAQDVIRWVVIGAILLGGLAKFLGF